MPPQVWTGARAGAFPRCSVPFSLVLSYLFFAVNEVLEIHKRFVLPVGLQRNLP